MTKHPTRRAPLALVLCCLVAALAGACSSDSPTEPSPAPPPPGGGVPPGTFNVTVTASPSELPIGSPDPAIIQVQVRRSDNGQAPPNGTTVVLSTSLGSLGSAGGPSSVVLSLNGGSGSVQLFPGTVIGTAVVQAQIQGSIGRTNVQIREPATFLISFVSPSTGSPDGGEVVTVHGSGFEDPVRVTFGGANAQVLSSSATQIRVVTPPSPNPATQPTTVAVSVTINVNEEGQVTDTLSGAFTYTPGGGSGTQPAVFSVTPASGPNEGGTVVTIVGSGFEAPVQVLFGQGNTTAFQGQEAVIRSVSSTRIVVDSPAARGFGQNNLNQLVDILVRNLDTGLATVREAAFQYGSDVLITGTQPGGGTYLGSELVTVFGQGFEAPVTVTFGGLRQTVISVSGTEIVVRSSAARVSGCSVAEAGFSGNRGEVTVTNINTGETATGPDFEYLIPEPLIFSVSPNSGPQGGGTSVVISGSGFEAPSRVLFGTQAATVTAQTPTTINARTPQFTGSFPVQACQVGDETGSRFLPASVALTVINLITGCDDTLPGAFNYNPDDPSCRIPTGGGGGP